MRGATPLSCLAVGCLALLLGCLTFLAGCDRNVEPYVEGEQPRKPDLSKIFPAGADEVARLDESVELPQPPGVAPAPGSTRRGPDATANASPISGVVRLAPAAGRVPDGGVVFLIARRGPGPPVAVRRVADPSFPLRFSIGPEDRMIQGIPFEGPFEIEARLDLDGEAISRGPEDLSGRSAGGHQPGTSDVEIVIGPLGSEQVARGAPPAPTSPRPAPASPAGAPLSGVVSVSPELAEGLPGGGVLFIIARVGGAGPPLAVRRVSSPSFPLEFSIGPEDRMIATRPFAGEIQLSARLDQDGNATSRSPGDLQGSAARAHAPGASDIEIVLGEKL